MSNKKVPQFIPWAIYLVYFATTSIGNFEFFIINVIVFGVVMLVGRRFKGKYNTLYSLCSIIIWSICIDIVCFFAWPQFVFGQSLIQYIGAGIAFNIKFFGGNLFLFAGFKALKHLLSKVKFKVKSLAGAQA
jgi:hypothetical protein